MKLVLAAKKVKNVEYLTIRNQCKTSNFVPVAMVGMCIKTRLHHIIPYETRHKGEEERKVTILNYDLNILILFMSEKVGEINDIVVSS